LKQKNLWYFSEVNAIIVYSSKSSNRLTYILKTLLNEGLGLECKLTADLIEFTESDLPKINYSLRESLGAFTIKPVGILADYGIRDYPIEVNSDVMFQKIFFRASGADLPFDLFGAAFWLLSRYEEYLPHKPDNCNRFHYKSSLAYQYDFIHTPLVNVWLAEFKILLSKQFPALKFKDRAYNFLSSIDIDNVYKYKYKGIVRTLAGFFSDKKISNIRQRFNISFRGKKDPFDCYDFLVETNKHFEIAAIYFFLLGDYGDNDKNHSSSNLHFQSLIKHLADYSMVGIHPSFGSRNDLKQLRIETGRLSNITHKNIYKSRQHFSILKFPDTYRDLLQAGITADYSMGYTNLNGFRASYCYPFQWYSLEIESASTLKLHPFSITENSVSIEVENQKRTFIEISKPLVAEVKKYNGQMVSVFHNNTFTQDMKKNYLEFLSIAK